MMLDLKKLFPNSKFPTAEELKAKEDTFSIGDRVKVANNIRCIQNGKIGTIVQIEPEDKHGWKSFIVKFDDEKYGVMGFQSGNIDKINKKETTMKKINENTKVTLTLGQLKKLVKEGEDGTGVTGVIATNKTVDAMKSAGVTPAQASQWANGNAATRDAMAKDLGAKFGHPEVTNQAGLYNAVAAQSGGRLSPTGASNVVHRAAVKVARESKGEDIEVVDNAGIADRIMTVLNNYWEDHEEVEDETLDDLMDARTDAENALKRIEKIVRGR